MLSQCNDDRERFLLNEFLNEISFFGRFCSESIDVTDRDVDEVRGRSNRSVACWIKYLTKRSLTFINVAIFTGINDPSLFFEDELWVGDIVFDWWMISWRCRKRRRIVSRWHRGSFCRKFRISAKRLASGPKIAHSKEISQRQRFYLDHWSIWKWYCSVRLWSTVRVILSKNVLTDWQQTPESMAVSKHFLNQLVVWFSPVPAGRHYLVDELSTERKNRKCDVKHRLYLDQWCEYIRGEIVAQLNLHFLTDSVWSLHPTTDRESLGVVRLNLERSISNGANVQTTTVNRLSPNRLATLSRFDFDLRFSSFKPKQIIDHFSHFILHSFLSLDRRSFCSDGTFDLLLINLNPFFFFGLNKTLKSCAVLNEVSILSWLSNIVLLFSFEALVFAEKILRLRSRSSSPGRKMTSDEEISLKTDLPRDHDHREAPSLCFWLPMLLMKIEIYERQFE